MPYVHTTTHSTVCKYAIYLVLLWIILIYFTVFRNSLTNWDDDLYILFNPFIQNISFHNLWRIWTTFYAGNYHPLTMFSFALNYNFGGIVPWHYQLTNLLLHLSNTLLVYLFVKKLLTLGSSALQDSFFIPFVTATLFGIHTLQVESVAWISERKNLLYVFFFLLSLLQYLKYLDKKSYTNYLLSLLFFLLSLFSKGMAVSLSLCLIGIDYYVHRNFLSREIVLEKLPFFLLSIIFGIIAVIAQHSSGSIRGGTDLLWMERITAAGYGFIQYFLKLAFPFRLSAFYPYPVKSGELLSYGYYLCVFLSVGILFLVWKYCNRNRMILFGTFFYISNIILVLQLLPVGDSIQADRYVYVASIGYFLIVGYIVDILLKKNKVVRTISIPLLLIYVILLSVKTYHRVGIWKDSYTLWEDVIVKYPANNDRAYLNRGNVLYSMGRFDEAQSDFEMVLRMDSSNGGAYIGRGLIKEARKDFYGARFDFDTAIKLHPTYEGYINRAALKMKSNDLNGALADLDKAYGINSYRTEIYLNRGYIYTEVENYQAALENFYKALVVDPLNYKAYIGIGRVNLAANNLQGAVDNFTASLSTEANCEGFLLRAKVKMRMKDYKGACIDLDNASRMNPFDAEVHIQKGILNMCLGLVYSALKDFNKAIACNRNNFQGYLFSAVAKTRLNDFDGAIADLDTSLRRNKNAVAFYLRGIANIRAGHKTNGCADLNQSAEMGDSEAKIALKINCK